MRPLPALLTGTAIGSGIELARSIDHDPAASVALAGLLLAALCGLDWLRRRRRA